MNGLQIIDLKEASFFQRLFKREPRENAFFEINNLLASVPILELDRNSIDSRLKKHEVSPGEARSRLNNFYSIILGHFLKDWELTNAQRAELAHLQMILNLDKTEVSSINSATIYPIYRSYVRKQVSNGEFSDGEKQQTDQLSNQLGLPKEFAREIYEREASDYLHSVLKGSLSDGMLSGGEEKELERIARNLGVELEFSANAKKNLDRCRYLWRLYAGDLPEIDTSFSHSGNEKSFVCVQAEQFEINKMRPPVRFSGYNSASADHGHRFNAGILTHQNIRSERVSFIDRGVLYFNEEQIYLNGKAEDHIYRFSDLVGGTFYENGLVIERKRGNDQFFGFSGDMQAIKLIFDSLMTRSRTVG